MKDNETLAVTTTVQISVERIKDLLCCAIEGGSNYWCSAMDRMGDIPREQAEYRQDVPFAGGWLRIIEHEPGIAEGKQTLATRFNEVIEGNTYECYRLDEQTIKDGLNVFASKYPEHFADFSNENDDASTGDIFLQCCLFGEAIYG